MEKKCDASNKCGTSWVWICCWNCLTVWILSSHIKKCYASMVETLINPVFVEVTLLTDGAARKILAVNVLSPNWKRFSNKIQNTFRTTSRIQTCKWRIDKCLVHRTSIIRVVVVSIMCERFYKNAKVCVLFIVEHIYSWL